MKEVYFFPSPKQFNQTIKSVDFRVDFARIHVLCHHFRWNKPNRTHSPKRIKKNWIRSFCEWFMHFIESLFVHNQQLYFAVIRKVFFHRNWCVTEVQMHKKLNKKRIMDNVRLDIVDHWAIIARIHNQCVTQIESIYSETIYIKTTI